MILLLSHSSSVKSVASNESNFVRIRKGEIPVEQIKLICHLMISKIKSNYYFYNLIYLKLEVVHLDEKNKIQINVVFEEGETNVMEDVLRELTKFFIEQTLKL